MKKAKVLVTGAGGFIGTAVIEALWQRNCEVVYFDLIDPKIGGIERINRGTILDQHDLALAVRGCDHAVHLAAMLGVKRTESNKLECLHINIQGTVNFLEACVKEGVKKVVFSSSSEVYGYQQTQPITEDSPLNPKSVYAASKLVGEQYFRAYSDLYDLNYNIVRFFNVYGEYQNDNFVLSKFVRNTMNGEAPTVYGDGKQIRSFCYVKDAARGLVDVLFSNRSGETYNIGNGHEPVTMGDLAEKVLQITGKSMSPVFVPYDQSDRTQGRDIQNRIPSIGKAKDQLGYEPVFSLEEGIKRMVTFYHKQSKG